MRVATKIFNTTNLEVTDSKRCSARYHKQNSWRWFSNKKKEANKTLHSKTKQVRQQGQFEKLQTHSKIENTKRLKNNLRGTGFVLNATSQTLSTLGNVGNVWVTLNITQRKLINHLRSLNPKKKRLKFSNPLIRFSIPGNVKSATWEFHLKIQDVMCAKSQSRNKTSKSNKQNFATSVARLKTSLVNRLAAVASQSLLV